MLHPRGKSEGTMADIVSASTEGQDIVCQRGLFSNLFQAFAEIADDFLEMLDGHGAEHVDTVSVVATAGVLFAPLCGVASHAALTHAIVAQAATEIIGPETTGLLSAALISVSVGRFLCSDWMLRTSCCAYLVKARDQFRQGLRGHWTPTTCTLATLPCLEYWGRKPSGASSSSQDVPPTSQPGRGEETEVTERRLDPLDGRIYTYQEITSFYRASWNASQIKSYWEKTCRPMTRRPAPAS